MAVTNERPPHVPTIRDATPLRNTTRQVWRALYQRTMPTPSFVFCDNKGALDLVKNNRFHKRTKHIDIKFFFCRWCEKMKELIAARTPSEFNLADGFTKAIDEVTLNDHRFPVQGQDVLPDGTVVYHQVERKTSKTKQTMEVEPKVAQYLDANDKAGDEGLSATLRAAENGMSGDF